MTTQGAPNVRLDHDAEEPIDAFLAYLRRRGRAASTRVKYEQLLLEYRDWLTKNGKTLAVTAIDIEFGYLEDWFECFCDDHGREPSANSQRNRIGALSSFYAFLDKKELLTDGAGNHWRNPMLGVDPIIVPRKPIRWLHADEDEALLACEMNEQERFVVWFLRWTGARVNEATGVLLSHLVRNLAEDWILIEDSKTPTGFREIPLFPELAPELRRWLQILKNAQRYSPQTPVLSTARSTAMQNGYVWRLVKRVAVRAGLRLARTRDGEVTSDVSPHTLRATFGSHLLNFGVRIEVVSYLLGHANTRVTEETYAELLKQTVRREALAALQGVSAVARGAGRDWSRRRATVR